jgi:UDP-glucose 4-epimerase
MAVLVTGGAGYVGSHMVLALADAGEETVVLDDLSTGSREAVHRSAKLIVGDAGDRSLVARLLVDHAIEEVIHLAAKIVVADSIADPIDYYRANTIMSHALIASLVAAGIERVVFSSTAAVYGAPAENPVHEEALLQPLSPYGSSKLMTEWMLRDAQAAYGTNYVTLRYFNVAGADPDGRAGESTPLATHLIKVACEAALGKRDGVDVFGADYATPDGTAVRDYVHVSDVVAAHLAALRHLRTGGESLTLNCGCGHGYSVLEVIENVKRVSGVNFPARHVPCRPGDPAVIVAKADRIRSAFGWRPGFSDLSTIVTHALEWERKLALQKPALR